MKGLKKVLFEFTISNRKSLRKEFKIQQNIQEVNKDMIKKIIKYTILSLFVVNLPLVALNYFGATMGALFSYSSFLLLIIYYFFFLVGSPPNYWMLALGLSYFTISGLQIYFTFTQEGWIIGITKYMLLMLFANSFFREVTKKEMIFFLLIGACSVMVNAFFLPSEMGRASGFYFNANPAGLACLFGYTLTYGIAHKTFKQLLQILFTLAGFVTFSRTFIIVWVIINLVSIKKSRKNIRIFIIGLGAFITLFIAGELLNLGGRRFDALKAVISNDRPKTRIDEDSRTSTWARFYKPALDAPFLGNGYGAFQGGGVNNIGVHNTYLLILGESGILPLIIFVLIFANYTTKAWQYFKEDETLLYMSITLALYLMTLHDFFEYYFMLSLVLFWMNQVRLSKERERQSNILY